MAGVMGTLSAFAGIAGTALSAVGTIAAGRAQQKAANFEAAQMEAKGLEERAGAQREALAAARQKRLALSRIQANAAGSGFSATDANTLDLMGETDEYGTYQQGIIQYGGESRQNYYKAQAKATRASGQSAYKGAMLSAAGTIVGGAVTMFDKYGRPGYGASAGRYG